MLRTSGISYYEQDGNGAVTSLSDSGGALVSAYASDSYGKMTSYAELWLDACRLCSGRFAVTGLAIKGAVGFCIYTPRMLLAGISMCPIKRRSTDFKWRLAMHVLATAGLLLVALRSRDVITSLLEFYGSNLSGQVKFSACTLRLIFGNFTVQ
jgi:hypothetical protein